MNGKQLTK